jgi:hypothetical protein
MYISVVGKRHKSTRGPFQGPVQHQHDRICGHFQGPIHYQPPGIPTNRGSAYSDESQSAYNGQSQSRLTSRAG